MRQLISILLIMILISMTSCSTEPEKLVYGKDVCQFCKMTLMDNKFGAELITDKGKVYKFDDIVCFLNFYNSDAESHSQYSYKLVVDYAHPGELINASDGLYIRSPAIKSPMAGNIAAFNSKDELDKFNKEWKGSYMSWGEIVTQFK